MSKYNNRNKAPVIIISAFLEDKTLPNNMARHEELKNTLISSSYDFKEVEGCYKGVKELSFCVLAPHTDQRADLIRLAQYFEQESVLFLDSQRRASLVYGGGKVEHIGTFKNVPKEVALSTDSYTKGISTDNYYITV